MKRLISFVLPMMAAISAQVMAVPTLNTLVAGADPLADGGVIGFQLTDTDGINDDINAFIFLESAGYAGVNQVGIYDWLDPSRMLTVFNGADAFGTSRTLSYTAGTFALGINTLAVVDPIFGVFLTNPEGTFYSNPALNADGFDHFAVFDTVGSTGLAGVFDFVVGIEDQFGGGDQDYNDFVFGITDVQPYRAQVPVPATGLLFAIGAAGLIASKKKKGKGKGKPCLVG